MQMRPCGYARIATMSDDLPLFDKLPIADSKRIEMRIKGLKSKRMRKPNQPTIAPIPPHRCILYYTIGGSIHGRIEPCAKVYARVLVGDMQNRVHPRAKAR